MRYVAIAGALVIGALPALADAKPVALKFAFPAPPRSLVNQWVFKPWVKEVNEASKGTLAIKIIAGPTMGNFRNIYARTQKGVADISFGVHGPMGKQFIKTSVGLLPYETNSVLEASVALWGIYERGAIADEYKNIKVLALFNFPHSSIHGGDKEIRTMEDLKSPPGNRLEVLMGDLRGFHSIRVNDQWRIIFQWSEAGAEQVSLTDYH